MSRPKEKVALLIALSQAWILLAVSGIPLNSVNADADFNKAKAERVKNEIASLYTSIVPRSSPLYICDPEMGGVEYQPPAIYDCDTEPHDNDTKKVINITLYWNDVSSHLINGYECSGTTEITKGYYYLTGLVKTEFTEKKIKISPEECWYMFLNKYAPNGDRLYQVANEMFETVNDRDVDLPMFLFGNTLEIEVTNFRVQGVQLGVREVDGSIRTTSFAQRQCYYNESSCPTNIGLLVWKGSEVKMCRLLEGEPTNCLCRVGTDGTTITCPDITLAMHGFELVEMCGEFFGHSQGIYFLQNIKSQVHEKMAMPDMVSKKISGNKRAKREIKDNIEKVHPFEAEVKANLNFLYDTVRRDTADVIWRFEKKFCEYSKSQLQLLSAMAISGHPSATTRFLTNNPALRATFEGDLMTIYECIEVWDYMFVERSRCTYQWPVKFVYGNNMYDGFVEPLTHTIVYTATKQTTRSTASCKRFFFQSNDYVVLLGKRRAVKVTAERIPHLAFRHHKPAMPNITFVPTRKLNPSSEDADESMFRFLREVQNRKSEGGNVRNERKTRKGGTKVDFSFTKWFADFGSAVGKALTGIFSFGSWLEKTLWIVAVIAVAVAFVYCIGPIKIVCGVLGWFVGKICRNMSRCARKCVKKIKKCCGRKRRRPRDDYAPSAPLLP